MGPWEWAGRNHADDVAKHHESVVHVGGELAEDLSMLVPAKGSDEESRFVDAYLERMRVHALEALDDARDYVEIANS